VTHVIGEWDGCCPICGTRDIALQNVTRYNEHWECINGHWFFVPIELSRKASREAGVRCIVDEMVADICKEEKEE